MGSSEDLDQEGYTVVPGVLTSAEVAILREQISIHLRRGGFWYSAGKVQWNAAVEVPAIEWVLYHPGVVEAVAEALGTEPVFTLHCDVHRNMANNWHKDSGEGAMPGGYFGSPQFDHPGNPVVKVGVYCQDHQDDSGLRVKRGTHHDPELIDGAELQLYTRPGDIVIFDVRITHRGDAYTPRLRALQRRIGDRSPRLVGYAQEAQFKAARKPDRIAAFFTYGAPGALTEAFSQRSLDQSRQRISTGLEIRGSLVNGLAAVGASLAPLA